MMIFTIIFSVCLAQATGIGEDELATSLLDPPTSTDLGLNGLPDYIYTILGNYTPSQLTAMCRLQPETLLQTDELIRYYGFPCEVHTVITQDGYILTLHRIPGGKTQTFNSTLHPIFVVHGILGSGGHFLSNTPENSFALLLAEAGFDVWLGNCRGSIDSRNHTFLNRNSDEYWNFSWDETAKYDIPAFIDYILQNTGKQQVYYSGHSLGAAVVFALGATIPAYMSKIRAIFAMAPMGNMDNSSYPYRVFAQSEPGAKTTVDTVNYHMVPEIPQLYAGCLGKHFDSLVKEIVFTMFGRSDQEWNSSRTEVNLAHLFSSMALNIILHAGQMINKTKFCKFDWGAEVNQQKYGQPTPPDYNISNINVPCYLYYGENDIFCPKNNAQFLKDNLQNATMMKAGNYWNHLDFIWSKNAANDFYNYLVAFIKGFVI